MADNSFFTGLGSLGSTQLTEELNSLQQVRVFPGHVLDICLDEGHPLFTTQRDIGKIRFRDLVKEYNRPEEECLKQAYPLDRSIARYPYPGEEVIIYRAFGETASPAALMLANIYYYTFVVSTHHNITYNQNPFIGGNENAAGTSYNTAKRRFEKKTTDLNTVRDGANKTKVYKQLQPQEGDFILQGRFGNSIRLGSTSAKNSKNEWNGRDGTGVAGDGIMVLRVDRDNTIQESTMYANERIDSDDATIYMCTSQKIPLLLACTKEMKSWGAVYGLGDNAADEASGLTTNKDSSKIWQKIYESDKPIDGAFQAVNQGGTQPPQPNQAPSTSNTNESDNL